MTSADRPGEDAPPAGAVVPFEPVYVKPLLFPEQVPCLQDVDTSEKPCFSVGVASVAIFGRSVHWLRYQEEHGKVRPVPRTEEGARVYTLSTLEDITIQLLEAKVLTAEQAIRALHVLYAIARLFKYLPDADTMTTGEPQ